MDADKEPFEVRFEGLPLNEAGTHTRQLREHLLDTAGVAGTIAKDDHANQDFGGTLVLLLATPAAIAVAHGIAAYLKRARASITISKDGEVVATGLSGQDAAKIAEAFSRRKAK